MFHHLYLLLLPLPDPFFSLLHLDFLPYLLASLSYILLYFSTLRHVISSDFYFILFHLSFIVSHQLFNPFIVIHLLLDFLLPFLLQFFIKILNKNFTFFYSIRVLNYLFYNLYLTIPVSGIFFSSLTLTSTPLPPLLHCAFHSHVF